MFKQNIIQLFLVTCLFFSHSVFADIEKGREIIGQLQNAIYKKVALNAEELDSYSQEFKEYYQTDVLPRLENISKNISDDAIRWVDIDFDQKPELVFWTEGLSPSAWGGKEYLFIVNTSTSTSNQDRPNQDRPNQNRPAIIESIDLGDVSRGIKGYQYVNFWAEPNRNRGYNDFLRVVFSYAIFGASGSTFKNIEIGWNRYENKVFTKLFTTAFPFSPLPPPSPPAIEKEH